MAKKNKKKGNNISLNFKGVKVFKVLPEGQYIVEVTETELVESSNGNPMIKFKFEVAEGPHKGAKLWHNSTITEEGMWAVRQVIDALGQDVPDGEMDLDIDELVGCQCGVNILHEEYEGKKRPKIADWMNKEDVEGNEDSEEDDEDETDNKKKKSSKKEIDLDNMDEDELAEFISENGLDVDLEDYKNIKKQRAAVKEAMEGTTEEDDEVETYTEDQIEDMDSEELQKLNDDLGLDLDDLSDEKPKAARKIMLKALKKKKLLAD